MCDANPVFYNDLRDGVTVQRVNATTDGPSRSVGIPAQYNSHQQIMHNGPEQSIEGVMSIERNDAGKLNNSAFQCHELTSSRARLIQLQWRDSADPTREGNLVHDGIQR